MRKTLLPEHLAKALEAGVEPLDVIQGHIKNKMWEIQCEAEDAKNDLPIKEDEYYESDMYYEGYNNALTDLYTLCYNVVFYQQDLERANG